METSKEVGISSGNKSNVLRYTYIFLSGVFVFFLSYFAARGISEEPNLNYSHFIHPLIWVIGFITQFFKRTLGMIIITIPVIFIIGTLLWIIF